MIRGDVCWYVFRPPDKRRPVLILTRDSSREFLDEVTVAPVTTRVRYAESEVTLTVDDGMERECAINLHHLQTVPKRKIGRVITHLDPIRMRQVRDALLYALGFDD